MTSTDVAATDNYPVGTVAAERVRLAEQVRVAVLFEGRQHDLTLPASSPVAAVADSLVRVLLTREGNEDGMRRPDDERMISPGVVRMTLISGQPLDRTQSLTQQGVRDGELLVLDIIDAEVEFTPIFESPSSAVAVLNQQQHSVVTAETARRVAGVVVAAAVAAVTALLGLAWWRNLDRGQDWNLIPGVAAAGLAVVLLVVGSLVWWRAKDSVTATAMWLSGVLIASPAAAVMVTPGYPGAWHLMLAAVVTAAVAAALWRLSPAPRIVVSATVLISTATAVLALIYALTGVSLQNLSVAVLAVNLFVLTGAPKLAARMAGIPIPPFPTVTGKDTFADADAIAAEALVAAEHQGTPTVEQLRRSAEAANIYLTALLVTVGVFFVGGSIWAVIPGQGRWWLATVYIGVLAAILVMRGRAFASREQSIIVVATGLLMVLITAANYALAGENTVTVYIAAAVVLGLGVAGLIAAAVVPAKVFSPVFRKVIEWIEYLLIVVIPPMAIWLLNLIYLARNM